MASKMNGSAFNQLYSEAGIETPQEQTRKDRISRPYALFLLSIRITVLLLAAWGLFNIITNYGVHTCTYSLITQPSTTTAIGPGTPMHPTGPWGLSMPALECDCGVTAEEGIRRGCRFFENELRWLQPGCHDQDLDDVFRENAPWDDGWHYEVHLDDNGTVREATSKELPLLVYPGRHVFLPFEHHARHCIIVWKWMWNQAWAGNGFRWNYTQGITHISHCGSTLLNRIEDNGEPSRYDFGSSNDN